MQAKWLQMLNRLEDLSGRERLMILVGVPLVLVVLGEFAFFGPARGLAAAAQKQAELQRGELKALGSALAAQPAAAPLAGADQLRKQRDDLQGQIEAARALTKGVSRNVDWGTVVRATVSGTKGLTLTQLKT